MLSVILWILAMGLGYTLFLMGIIMLFTGTKPDVNEEDSDDHFL